MNKKKSLLSLLMFCMIFVQLFNANTESVKAQEYTETVYSKVVTLKDGFDQAGSEETSVASEIDTSSSKFGSQLDADQYKVYTQLVKYYVTDGNTGKASITDVEKNFTEETKESVLAETFLMMQSAMDAMLKDYPQVFWINSWQMNITKRVNTDTTGKYHNLSIDPYPYYDEAINDIPAVNTALANLKASIDNKLAGTTRRDTILKTIYEELVNIGIYDTAYENTSVAHTPASLLLDKYNHLTICEGYAKTFKILCDRYNIPCVIVYGNTTGVGHMWNEVQMEDEKWYGIDLTWEENTAQFTYNYFLAGSKTMGDSNEFSVEHIPDGVFSKNSKEFSYPALATEKYVYTPAVETTTAAPETTATVAPETTTTAAPETTTPAEITTAAETTTQPTTTVAETTTQVTTTKADNSTTTAAEATTSKKDDSDAIVIPSSTKESSTDNEDETTTTVAESTTIRETSTTVEESTTSKNNASKDDTTAPSVKPQDNGAVNTGDSTQPLLYIAILVISAIIIFILILRSKKKIVNR